MDQAVALDTLGRRSGSRRYRNIEEKRRIVEESLVPGTSVAMIARKYEVNANQVFSWRRLYQQGLLEVRDAGVALAMMPVRLAEEEPSGKRRAKRKTVTPPTRRSKTESAIEIEFAGGQRLKIQGQVDATALAQIIALLSPR